VEYLQRRTGEGLTIYSHVDLPVSSTGKQLHALLAGHPRAQLQVIYWPRCLKKWTSVSVSTAPMESTPSSFLMDMDHASSCHLLNTFMGMTAGLFA
jgi:hypothetical protein